MIRMIVERTIQIIARYRKRIEEHACGLIERDCMLPLRRSSSIIARFTSV